MTIFCNFFFNLKNKNILGFFKLWLVDIDKAGGFSNLAFKFNLFSQVVPLLLADIHSLDRVTF